MDIHALVTVLETAMFRRRTEWCLLGVDLETGVKTYLCRTCGKWLSLVSPGAQLPSQCPKCGRALRAPDEAEFDAMLRKHAARRH